MYHFRQKLTIQKPLNDVFAFFSDASNLEAITPEFLHFKILTPLPLQMREGALIDYRIRIHRIPLKWRTLITEWNPPWSFTDEQIKGPYRVWRHRHSFTSVDDGKGTLMEDHVVYSLIGGRLARFMVKKDIHRIFNHRSDVLSSIFN